MNPRAKRQQDIGINAAHLNREDPLKENADYF
jgi:hypothetical protein